MGKIIYDFREGIDKEKIIYRNTSCDWASFFKWTGSVLLAYIWTCAWFALFNYAYINHAKTVFWTNTMIWIAFVIFFIARCVYVYIRHYNRKNKIKREKLLKEKEKEMAKDTENKYATRPKNELDLIELQNLKETDHPFFNSNQ